jgi:citrate lyase subunit beta/citryl-CoA lyase
VRVNDWTTPWTYTDVIEMVSTAGSQLDIVVLPKVSDASHIHALDLLLTQLEKTHGLEVGRIGIEAQIETARGLTNLNAIAAGPRVQAVILGPADLIAVRTHGVAAIDGPYLKVRDVEGFRRVAGRSAMTASGCCIPTRSQPATRYSARAKKPTTTPS